MTRPRTHDVAMWLAANPAPIRRVHVEEWADRVSAELGAAAVPALLGLLAEGEPEQQYQAMAAARALGADVWLEGDELDASWLVTLPNETVPRRIPSRSAS